MRFHSAVALAASAAVSLAFAAADAVKAQITGRLQAQLANAAPADLALGAAAFDEDLRAEVESHAAETTPVVEAGRKLWITRFRDGRTLASCFPNAGRRIADGEPLYDAADARTMGAIVAYVRSLANGQKIAVRVPAAAERHFEQGRRLYFTRMGQRNFACASCHVQGAGRRFGDSPLSAVVGQATHWPLVRDGEAVTAQARMRECLELMGAAPFAAGSDELNDLEYFVSYLSNGLPVKANAWRPKQAAPRGS